MSARSVTVQLSIPAERLLRYYEGHAREVVATAENGQTVRFPAAILRNQVSHDGVHGRFRIEFDEHGRFLAISALNQA